MQWDASIVRASIAGFGICLTSALVAPPAASQCTPRWDAGFAGGGLSGGSAFAFALFDDDGVGPHVPVLVAGGTFLSAGGNPAVRVAKWDGVAWTPLGSGMNLGVASLCVFDDDGAGPNLPALYAGGDFTMADGAPASHIAKWDGESWSSVGTGTDGSVNTMAVFDEDGSGPQLPALFVGGAFTDAGGGGASHVAKWDGTFWTVLGSGVDANVWALASFDPDASGPAPAALYAGGQFVNAGGVFASRIARWNGSSWSAVSGGTAGGVSALCVLDDDGPGPVLPALYVGGDLTAAGGSPANGIARYDGSSWSALGSGTDDRVLALAVYDADGAGPGQAELCVGGSFDAAGGFSASKIAFWDGSAWSAIDGMGGGSPNPEVFALTSHDADGTGPGAPRLFAGGSFGQAGDVPASRIAAWDGTSWSTLDRATNGAVYAQTVFAPEGESSALYVSGNFTVAGGRPASNVARFDGSSWSTLGSGFDQPASASTVFDDDGTGPHSPSLYFGGGFTTADGTVVNRIARWDGTSFSSLAGGVDPGFFGSIAALAVHDVDGPGPIPAALYAGGDFSYIGGVPAENIAKWDGSSWSALSSGIGPGAVNALAVYDDDGNGPHLPALYAGGSFDSAGGVAANTIARWNGSTSSPVGTGLSGLGEVARSLAVHDPDGPGPGRPLLYAGGIFDTAGGIYAPAIASWDGSSWSSVGGGVSGLAPRVMAMTTFDDDGSGPNSPGLYVGGAFDVAGGVVVNSIARWRDSTWSALSTGMGDSSPGDPLVTSLTVFDLDEGGPEPASLYVGGLFAKAGPFPSSFFARRNGCGSSVEAFCPGDGTIAACPCANSGASGRGCQNSASTGGALLTSAGNAGLVADTLTITSSGELPSSFSIFLQGNAQIAPIVFGDGLRCVGGALKRLYTKNAQGGVAAAPTGSEPTISLRSAERGDPLVAGAARYYQTYYRDPNASFCPAPPGSTFNASSGLAVVWAP